MDEAGSGGSEVVELPGSVDWFFWRPVHAGMATLEEVRRKWTVFDIFDAHSILDAFEDAERRALAEQQQQLQHQ